MTTCASDSLSESLCSPHVCWVLCALCVSYWLMICLPACDVVSLLEMNSTQVSYMQVRSLLMGEKALPQAGDAMQGVIAEYDVIVDKLQSDFYSPSLTIKHKTGPCKHLP